MDDEEDEDIYTFQTPVKANVNVALEVSLSSPSSRSMPQNLTSACLQAQGNECFLSLDVMMVT